MLGLVPTEYWEYGLGDVIRGLAVALRPGKSDGEVYIPEIGNCIPARSGRAAIIAIIKALELPRGARVGVPLYCCPVVFKAIKAAGCVPRYIDVNLDTFCMSPDDLSAKSSDVDAVIAVHMFGNVCDVPSLEEAVKGKPVIEDCAQSLGSKLGGRMSGSMGSISFFSFRSGKYLSVGEGAAIFSRQENVRRRLRELISAMPIPSRADECAHVGMTYLRSALRRKPLYGLVGYPLWSAYNKAVDHSEKSNIVLSQAYSTDLAIAMDRMKLLDSAISRQRANAEFYSRSLKLDSRMICREGDGTFYNRYLYPIIFYSKEDRDLMGNYLQKRGIAASKPYRDIAEVAAGYYGYTGDCPVSEQIARRVLAIPCNYSLRESDLEYIAQCVNEGWGEIGGHGCNAHS